MDEHEHQRRAAQRHDEPSSAVFDGVIKTTGDAHRDARAQSFSASFKEEAKARDAAISQAAE
ncbi:hypothetical protein [Candidimonas nitroreducens]|uniref:hypothetical protein n=1 Tax=Candidimonas nitroreducens TaxID=683354 RepID=UPI0011785549|nr:hypothetical protein [Candidimonas nitroreducens]